MFVKCTLRAGTSELEALEIGESSLDLATNEFLTPRGGLPLGNHVVLGKGSLDGLGGGTAGEGEAGGGEGDPLHTDHLAGHVGGGSINDDSVLVNDVRDDSNLISKGAIGDHNEGTGLDEPGEGLVHSGPWSVGLLGVGGF